MSKKTRGTKPQGESVAVGPKGQVFGSDENGNASEWSDEVDQRQAAAMAARSEAVGLSEDVPLSEHVSGGAEHSTQMTAASPPTDADGEPLVGSELGPSGIGALDGAAGVRAKISPEENNLRVAGIFAGVPVSTDGAMSIESLRLVAQNGTATPEMLERLGKLEQEREADELARTEHQRTANEAVQLTKAREKKEFEEKLAKRRAERENERLEAEQMTNAEASADGYVGLCKIDPRDGTSNFYAGWLQSAFKSLGLDFKVTDSAVEGTDGSVSFQVLWVKPGDLEKVANATNAVTQLPKRAEQASQGA